MSLLFNVAQLLKESIGATRNEKVTAGIFMGEDEQLTRVNGSIRMLHTDSGIWIDGILSITLEMACSRCLVPFAQWIDLEVSELFRSTIDIHTGRKLDFLKDPEDQFTIDYHHHLLDISESVRQYMVTAVPVRPLCTNDCQGFCSKCGSNLNEENCDCTADIDPRWAPLRSLFP